MAALTNPMGTQVAGGNQVVTPVELEANKPYGWFVNPGGAVYQRLNILTHEVRYIGQLEQVNDLVTLHPESKRNSSNPSSQPHSIESIDS